jgi:GxxExxY protein
MIVAPSLQNRPSVLIEDDRLNRLTGSILGCAIEVHRTLGPGLLESIYATCLQVELAAHNLRFRVQQPVPVVYKGALVDATYRLDLVVEDVVVVEIKSVDTILPVHKAQVLTYLRVSGHPAGLLINFNVSKLTDGVRRLINPLH